MIAAVASVPSDSKLSSQDLVLVNPPDYVYVGTAIPIMRALAGKPAPRRLRALAAVPASMRVTTIDSNALRVHLERGLFEGPFTRYHRAEELGFEVGQRIELSNFAVEVIALDSVGD